MLYDWLGACPMRKDDHFRPTGGNDVLSDHLAGSVTLLSLRRVTALMAPALPRLRALAGSEQFAPLAAPEGAEARANVPRRDGPVSHIRCRGRSVKRTEKTVKTVIILKQRRPPRFPPWNHQFWHILTKQTVKTVPCICVDFLSKQCILVISWQNSVLTHFRQNSGTHLMNAANTEGLSQFWLVLTVLKETPTRWTSPLSPVYTLTHWCHVLVKPLFFEFTVLRKSDNNFAAYSRVFGSVSETVKTVK